MPENNRERKDGAHHVSFLASVEDAYQRTVRERVGSHVPGAHLPEEVGGLSPPLARLERHEEGVVMR